MLLRWVVSAAKNGDDGSRQRGNVRFRVPSQTLRDHALQKPILVHVPPRVHQQQRIAAGSGGDDDDEHSVATTEIVVEDDSTAEAMQAEAMQAAATANDVHPVFSTRDGTSQFVEYVAENPLDAFPLQAINAANNPAIPGATLLSIDCERRSAPGALQMFPFDRWMLTGYLGGGTFGRVYAVSPTPEALEHYPTLAHNARYALRIEMRCDTYRQLGGIYQFGTRSIGLVEHDTAMVDLGVRYLMRYMLVGGSNTHLNVAELLDWALVNGSLERNMRTYISTTGAALAKHSAEQALTMQRIEQHLVLDDPQWREAQRPAPQWVLTLSERLDDTAHSIGERLCNANALERYAQVMRSLLLQCTCTQLALYQAILLRHNDFSMRNVMCVEKTLAPGARHTLAYLLDAPHAPGRETLCAHVELSADGSPHVFKLIDFGLSEYHFNALRALPAATGPVLMDTYERNSPARGYSTSQTRYEYAFMHEEMRSAGTPLFKLAAYAPLFASLVHDCALLGAQNADVNTVLLTALAHPFMAGMVASATSPEQIDTWLDERRARGGTLTLIDYRPLAQRTHVQRAIAAAFS